MDTTATQISIPADDVIARALAKAVLPTFSFATASPWLGFDVPTMRVLSRAHVIQSEFRSERSSKKTKSMWDLLQAVHADDEVLEDDVLEDEALQPLDLRETPEEIDMRERRDRDALINLRLQATRSPVTIMRDTQLRSAVASHRWG